MRDIAGPPFSNLSDVLTAVVYMICKSGVGQFSKQIMNTTCDAWSANLWHGRGRLRAPR